MNKSSISSVMEMTMMTSMVVSRTLTSMMTVGIIAACTFSPTLKLLLSMLALTVSSHCFGSNTSTPTTCYGKKEQGQLYSPSLSWRTSSVTGKSGSRSRMFSTPSTKGWSASVTKKRASAAGSNSLGKSFHGDSGAESSKRGGIGGGIGAMST